MITQNNIYEKNKGLMESNENLLQKIMFLTQKNKTLEERIIEKTRENENLLSRGSPKTNSDLEISVFKTKIKDLEQNNLLLSRENEYYRKITSNKGNIELKTTKILELEENCSKLLQENAKINEICKNYMKENEDLKFQIKEFQQKYHDPLKMNIYNEISDLTKKNLEFERQLKEFQTDNEFLAYKIKEKEIEFKNERDSFEVVNNKLINENRIFLVEKEKLLEEVKNFKEKNSAISLENKDLELKFNQIKKELESQKLQNLENEKKMRNFMESAESNHEKTKEISKLLSDLEQKDEKIREYEKKNNQNLEEIENMKKQINYYEVKISTIQKNVESEFQMKNENNSDKFQKLLEKCKNLQQEINEKNNLLNTLKIYQEKYETLFEEANQTDVKIAEIEESYASKVFLLSAEIERLHNIMKEYVNYQKNESKNRMQYNKNFYDYNNLCLLLKDVEKTNIQLKEENQALRLVNEQKTKEINNLMIEISHFKKINWEIGRLEQENQHLVYELTKTQQNPSFTNRRYYSPNY